MVSEIKTGDRVRVEGDDGGPVVSAVPHLRLLHEADANPMDAAWSAGLRRGYELAGRGQPDDIEELHALRERAFGTAHTLQQVVDLIGIHPFYESTRRRAAYATAVMHAYGQATEGRADRTECANPLCRLPICTAVDEHRLCASGDHGGVWCCDDCRMDVCRLPSCDEGWD